MYDKGDSPYGSSAKFEGKYVGSSLSRTTRMSELRRENPSDRLSTESSTELLGVALPPRSSSRRSLGRDCSLLPIDLYP